MGLANVILNDQGQRELLFLGMFTGGVGLLSRLQAGMLRPIVMCVYIVQLRTSIKWHFVSFCTATAYGHGEQQFWVSVSRPAFPSFGKVSVATLLNSAWLEWHPKTVIIYMYIFDTLHRNCFSCLTFRTLNMLNKKYCVFPHFIPNKTRITFLHIPSARVHR